MPLSLTAPFSSQAGMMHFVWSFAKTKKPTMRAMFTEFTLHCLHARPFSQFALPLTLVTTNSDRAGSSFVIADIPLYMLSNFAAFFQAPLECLGSHLEADLSWPALSAKQQDTCACSPCKQVSGSLAERWILPLPVRPAADGCGLSTASLKSPLSESVYARQSLCLTLAQLRPPLTASCSTAVTFSAGAAAQHLPMPRHDLGSLEISRNLSTAFSCKPLQLSSSTSKNDGS